MKPAFDLLPALDVMEGRVVRLRQGREGEATTYDRDPLDLLAEFKKAGARRVHMVDLSGAIRGERQKGLLDLLRKSPLPVELGGGLRRREDVASALEAGAERVILGTMFLEEPRLGEDLIKAFGPKKILGGLDVKEGLAVGRGWAESGSLPAPEAAKRLKALGLDLVIITPVRLDGTLQGPAVEEARALAEGAGLSYIYAGGVSSQGDVLKIRDQGGASCRGAISGKALYDGRLDLAATLKALQS